MIASNSTALVYLSKINKLFLLKELFGNIVIPEAVKREVVNQGKQGNHIDAFVVESAITEGWIKVAKVTINPLLENIGIDKGEAEAISLAAIKKCSLLVDQTHAREAAKLIGVRPKGTLFILLLAMKKGLLTYDGYLQDLFDLAQAGFRMSQEVYLDALRGGKEIGIKK